MGNIVLHNPVVDFSRDKKGTLASTMFNGIIGADILFCFTVVFDYEKKIIALKKTREEKILQFSLTLKRLI